jgi:DNA-binding MarR family transcriptional regulator
MIVSNRYDLLMTVRDLKSLHALIERLGRLVASESWAADLTPSQAAALGYLQRANRFSRGPSQVADYLGATRGTVSQTLLVLERKGLIVAQTLAGDQRRSSYGVTDSGREILKDSGVGQILAALPPDLATGFEAGLRAVLTGLLTKQGHRAFGQCLGCRHHQATASGAWCQLLRVDLQPEEVVQICWEQVPRAA